MSNGGVGPANHGYSGAMPSGMNNEVRYRDQMESAQVAQYRSMMDAQRSQMAAANTMSNASPRMYGGGSDELARRMYQRQAYVSQNANMGGILKGGADLAGWQAGAGIMSAVGAGGGLLGGFVAPAAIAAAAVVPISKGINRGMARDKSAMNTAMDFDTYRDNLGFAGGMNFQQASRAGYEMRNQMSSNKFFGSNEMERIHKMGMSNGLLDARGGANSGTMKQYSENFKDLTETTEEIVKTLKTTIEGGMSVIKELNQAGFSGKSLRNEVKNMAATAKGTGMSVQNVMGMAAAGAQAVQGTPWSAQTGSRMYVDGMNAASMMSNSNNMGARAVDRVGGAAQAGAIIANAQASQMMSGYGTKYMAYMMNNDGTINEDRKNNILNNRVSASTIVNGANERGYAMGPSGRVMFESRKQQAYDSMTPDEMSDISRSMFDQWGKGRGGSREAKSMVWAKQWGNNAREVELLHSYNMRARGMDKTKAYRDITSAASIDSKAVSAARGGFMGGLDSTGDFLSDVGEDMYGYATSRQARTGRARAAAFGKGALMGAGAGALIGGAPGAILGGIAGGTIGGIMHVNRDNNNFGGAAGKLRRGMGLSSKYETFSSDSYSTDPTSGLEIMTGLSDSRAVRSGSAILRDMAEAGGNPMVDLNLKKMKGDAEKGEAKLKADGFYGMSPSAKAAYRNGIINAATNGVGGKGLQNDSNFLTAIGAGVNTKRHKALGNQTDFSNEIAALDVYAAGSEDRYDAALQGVAKATAGMSTSANIRNEKIGKSAYDYYDAAMSNPKLMKKLGVDGNTSFADFQKALKSKKGRGMGVVTTNAAQTSYAELNVAAADANSNYSIGSAGVSLGGVTKALKESIDMPMGDSTSKYVKSYGSRGFEAALQKEGVDRSTPDGQRAYINGLDNANSNIYTASKDAYFKNNKNASDKDWNEYVTSAKKSLDNFDAASAVDSELKRVATWSKQNAKRYTGKDKPMMDKFFKDMEEFILTGDDDDVSGLVTGNAAAVKKLGWGTGSLSDFEKSGRSNVIKTFIGSDMNAGNVVRARKIDLAVNTEKVDAKIKEFKENNDITSLDAKKNEDFIALMGEKQDLIDKNQKPSDGGSSKRSTVINPPVISYWNNNWAVR